MHRLDHTQQTSAVVPLEIVFRRMPASETIEDALRQQLASLATIYDRIVRCRVVVSKVRDSSRHVPIHVEVELTVPGKQIVVNGRDTTYESTYAAIADPFHAARRQLQRYVDKLKAHDRGRHH